MDFSPEYLQHWHLTVVDGKLYAVDKCDDGVINLIEIEEIILHKETKHHQIEIARYKNFGIGLRMDGSQQTCEADSAKYRQGFVHPTILFDRGRSRCVLCYGAGDFELVSELIKYPNIARIKIVDWDPDFMEIAKTHLLPIHKNSWQDHRLKIETEFPDAFAYMKKGREKFHYIYVDLTDNSVAEVLKRGMGRKLRLRLIPNGKVIIQAGELSASPEALQNLLQGIAWVASSFRYFWIYGKYIPFFRYTQGFIIATDDPTFNPMYPSAFTIDQAIEKKIGERLAEYTGLTHQGLFAVPRAIAKPVYGLLGSRFPQFYLL